MDQRISPTVVVVVLILIVAIVVALYFLVVQATPQLAETGGVMRPRGPEKEVQEASAEETEAEGEAPAATESAEPSATE